MSEETMTPENSSSKLEKYKYNVELAKWLISSVVLVVMTTIIDWGFRDRAAGLQEIQQYDKYATELIILNDNPKNKRMLAQYFSYVIPSEKLREGWKQYYKEVNDEYTAILRQDSIAKSELEKLKADSLKLSGAEKQKVIKLQQQVDNNQRMLRQPLIISNSTVIPTVYIQFSAEEQRANAKNIEDKIASMGFNAPGVELVSTVKLTTNEIRYFRDADISSANTLKSLLKEQHIDVVIKFMPGLSNKTKEGTLELWLK